MMTFLFPCVCRFIYSEDNIGPIDELIEEPPHTTPDTAPQTCPENNNPNPLTTHPDTAPSLDHITEDSQAQEAWDKQENGEGPESMQACSQLGSDLLNMYLHGNDHDISLKVESQTFRAHRYDLFLALLAQRCLQFCV